MFKTLHEKYVDNGKWLSLMKNPEITNAQRIYQMFAASSYGSRASIDSFNSWVENDLSEQLRVKSCENSRGDRIEFISAKLNKPMKKNLVTDESIPLFPSESRFRKIPYSGTLSITYKKINSKGDILAENTVNVGEIPVVVGSNLCHLSSLTPEERVEKGECLSSIGGNVIIKGEKVAAVQEKLRCSKSLIVGTNMTMTNYNFELGSIKTTFVCDNWNRISINIGRIMNIDKNLPIFCAFQLFSVVDVKKIIGDFIIPFIPSEFKEAVVIYLRQSIIEYNSIKDLYDYIESNSVMPKYIGDKNAIMKKYSEDFVKCIFHHSKDNKNKIYTLGHYVSRLILHNIGVIPEDNRNNWSNKRFEPCGKMMLELFNSLVNKMVGKITESDNEMSVFKSYPEMRKTFNRSFSTATWGVKGGFSKEGISEQYHRSTPMEKVSSVGKTNVPTSRRNKIIEIRDVDASQHCYHCPNQTPDNDSISLVKYQSACCIISQNETLNIKIVEEVGKGDYFVLYQGNIVTLDKVDAYELYDKIIKLRRSGVLKTVEIYIDEKLKTIEIYTDDSRPAAPFFIVENGELVIEKKKKWNLSLEELLNQGCVEYLCPRERENDFIIIATHTDELSKKDYGYTHCMLDPIEMFSVNTACCPYSNHQPGPRTQYQGGMFNQQLGFHDLNHFNERNSCKVLVNPRGSLTMTIADFMGFLDFLPPGQPVTAAFIATDGTQEDSAEVCESFIKRGGFSYYKYTNISRKEANYAGIEEEYCRPAPRKNETEQIYHAIQDNGLPKIGEYINEGDCVIGSVIKTNEKTINNSTIAGIGKKGYVVKVSSIVTEGNTRYIEVKLRFRTTYKPGDKTEFRYSQKRTISKIIPRDEMIRVRSGPNKDVVPDIVFNVHSIPSRSTIGLLLEGIQSKAALFTGEKINATAFTKHSLEKASDVLEKNGLRGDGTEEFEMSDGTPIRNRIFFVPLSDCPLKHQTEDKIQSRDYGKKNIQTRQPVGGRENAGAIRFGEMERAVLSGYGCSASIQDRMLYASDFFEMMICSNKNCGRPIKSNPLVKDKFEPVCDTCDEPNVKKIQIPFASWLFFNILGACAVDTQIRV